MISIFHLSVTKCSRIVGLFILFISFCLPADDAFGQQVSVTLGNISTCTVGDTVTVPISVQNFNNVGAVSLELNYDSSALTFVDFNNSGLLTGTLIVNNPSPAGIRSGKVLVSWFSLTSSNIGNGLLMNLRFKANATSSLNWNLAVVGQCELADENGEVINNVVFNNGSVSVGGATITTQPASALSLNAGASGSLSVVANGASGYQWQVNSGGGTFTNLSNGGGYSGVTTSTLGIVASTSMNGNQYRVVLSGGACGGATSTISTLTVTSASSLASLTTTAVSSITSSNAATGGNVTSDGGAVVTARGVAYGTSSNPTTSGSSTSNGTGTGVFTSQLSGLSASTNYFVRAYATNSVGTAYGNQVTFTTLVSASTDIVIALGQASGCRGTSVTIPITVQNFLNIGAVSLDLPYDTTALTYTGFNSPNLPGNLIVNHLAQGGGLLGKVLVSWFSLTSSNLGNGLMMNLTFTVNETTPLVWNTSVAGQCELADGDGNVLTNVIYSSGLVTSNSARITTQPPAIFSLPLGTSGILSAVAGGASSYQWQVNNGTGIWTNLNNGGGYSGVTTASLGITASNSLNGNQYRLVVSGGNCPDVVSNVTTFSLLILTLPTLTTTPATAVTSNSATTGGNVTSDGGAAVTARGVAYGLATNPTISGLVTTNGSGPGVFTSSLSGLTSATTYNVRAYGTNSVGTAYGNQIAFTTLPPPVFIPTLSTTAVTSITTNSALTGGNITSDGGAVVSSRGVAYGTAQNPTTAGNRTNDGAGTGVFTSSLTGLSIATTYYVRAYATNNAGTAYGNQQNFITLSPAPVLSTLTTTPATSITATEAITGGEVISDGGALVTSRGVAYGTGQSPTTSGATTANGTGIGNFTSSLSGLAPATDYFVRAYAVNSVGTSYGNQITFQTSAPSGMVVSLGQASACSNSTVTIPINVQNFINIGAVTLDILYDSAALLYTGFNNPGLTGNLIVNSPMAGRVLVSWFSLTPSNIGNGLMMNLTFRLNGTSTLNFNTAVPGQCELADGGGEVVQDVIFSNGLATANDANIIVQPVPSLSLTIGATGTLSVAAVGATSFQWQVNLGGGNWTDLRDGSDYSGVTTPTLSIVASSALNGNQYRVLASGGGCPSVTSSVSVLTIVTGSLPTVTTAIVSNITATSSTTGGNVTSDGGLTVTARGVAYGTSQNPTISGLFTSDGTGRGAFVSSLVGLTAATLYNVRAYATNALGTQYGNQESFTTLNTAGVLPTVTTGVVTSITPTGATTGGYVISEGGSPVTNRGVAYGTLPLPTTAGFFTSNGSGLGTFVSLISGLTPSTNYYVRAYASSNLGTAYGSEESFTTAVPAVVLPTVTTTPVSAVTSSTAVTGGEVVSNGGSPVTTRGVAYGQVQNPSLAGAATVDGSGTGAFASNLTGLIASTTYYVRAYATNSLGTAYGSQIGFTTLNPPGTLVISAQTVQACAGTVVGVPINISSFDSVTAFQIVLEYSRQYITYTSVSNVSIPNLQVFPQVALGRIVLLWSGPVGTFSSNQGLCELEFLASNRSFIRFNAAQSTFLGASGDPVSRVVFQNASYNVTQPVSAGVVSGNPSVCVGGNANYTSTVSGGIWSSSDSSIVSINSTTGLVTGISSGTANIIYSVNPGLPCGVATSTFVVGVVSPPVSGVLSGNQNLCVGASASFSSTVTGGSWSSSNTAVATVSVSTGAVTGVAAGTATITYTVNGTGGCANATATRTVTVTAAPTAGTLSGTQAICVGSNSTFTSTATGGSWSSSNPAVAIVNTNTGSVTGVAAGTASITYTVNGSGGCTNVTATRTVTVTAAPTAGNLSGTQAICVGSNTTFTSTATGGSWSSSNPAVATVNANTGAVTGVAAGTATITFTVNGTGGCSNASATRTITVTAPASAGTLSGNQNLCIGATATYSSTISGGSWSSGNPAIAAVNSATGSVTAISAGSVVLTYSVPGAGGCPGAYASLVLNVSAPPSAGTLSGIQTLCTGGASTLTSTVTGGVWSSSNLSVATIDASLGIVTGISAGTASITYTVAGLGGCSPATASLNIFVTAAPSAGIVSGNQQICVDNSATFSSTVTGGSWSSSNTAVAIVNASTGIVTGISAGSATITYTVNGTGGCANATATRTVTVTAASSAGTLSGTQAICVGSNTQFTSTTTGGSWSSSNTAIATVNANTGEVTGVAAGTATITYTVNGSGGCANALATRTVTVNARPSAPTISLSSTSDTLFSSVSTGVRWSRNGLLISGANGPLLVINQNGVYRAIVVDANGCVSDSSNAINVTNVSIFESGFDQLSLYPNPGTGLFRIQFQSPDNLPVQWTLVNSLGQVVRTERVSINGENVQTVELDFSDFASGLYTIHLSQSVRVGHVKCVIRR